MSEIDQIAFRPGQLRAKLIERADGPGKAAASRVAQRDLDRYYHLLTLALASIELSQNEAMLLVDMSNGTLYDMVGAPALHYEIEDAVSDLAEKWGIDGAALAAKAASWSLIQKVAVIDALERFWADSYHVSDTRARLVRVGLVK